MTSTIMYQPETLFNDTNAFNVSEYASKGYFFNDRTTDEADTIVWPSPVLAETSWTEITQTTDWTDASLPTTEWSEV